ncbi:uncharacterized protein LOC135936210 [Cloeon dipterum]|uniref:uncharacterized protein LOC135936210 n=1 Tax=Cloeon dipterum TaxID=197152 RepID=UPI0032202C1B
MDTENELLCMKWMDFNDNLRLVFSRLLQDECLVDVTIACDGQFIRAHKVILSASSIFFQDLFQKHSEHHPIIILKDVKIHELRSLMDFVYKGEVNIRSYELQNFMLMARNLGMKGLCLSNTSDESNIDSYPKDEMGKIRSEDDVEALQEDLAHIDVWCANNGMQLNVKKCVVMDVTRARQPCMPRYTDGGTALQYVATQRLLGLHLSRDLLWNHHVDVQRRKAVQTLGFAARNLSGCTQRMKMIVYLSLVKPKLFYGTPEWHPSTKTNTEKMIRVQNRALHFIHGRCIPPPNQQNLLSVPAQLEYINDLLYFKKCLAGVMDYDAMARITPGRVHRGNNPLHPRLQLPSSRTYLGKNIFDYRVVKEWNDMPPALKDCSAAQFPSL